MGDPHQGGNQDQHRRKDHQAGAPSDQVEDALGEWDTGWEQLHDQFLDRSFRGLSSGDIRDDIAVKVADRWPEYVNHGNNDENDQDQYESVFDQALARLFFLKRHSIRLDELDSSLRVVHRRIINVKLKA